MAINQTGIAITIKAFLPIGTTLDEQLEALTMVKAAHQSGDYAEVLKASSVDEVKSVQKVRRVEEAPEALQEDALTRAELGCDDAADREIDAAAFETHDEAIENIEGEEDPDGYDEMQDYSGEFEGDVIPQTAE